MSDAVAKTDRGGLERARVLVTGATGFLGSHLARELVRMGCEVGALVRDGADMSRIHDVQPRLQFLSGDVTDGPRAQALVRGFRPTVVFHLAAYGVNAWACDPAQAVTTNVLGTITLLEACRSLSLEAFVYIGTWFETPEPVNAYAASKAAGWLFGRLYDRMHQVPVVGVRPFQVYGPGEAPNRLIPSVILSALQGREVQATEGRQVRDFIFVEDVVAGMIRAAACPKARGQMFDLGTGTGIEVRAVIEQLMELLGHPVPVAYGALPYRAGEIWHLVADPRAAKQRLGWTPRVTLSEGLRRTIERVHVPC